ncbi:MAG: SDR family oxidoreductase [Deltaproteobacteria bacterium]|nr:SDR family oxidoreductase [Deltaproteobacteria bacterium]
MFDLTDKVAVITGSTRGIGRAIARQMAVHGAKVVISSRKADACAAAAEEINRDVASGTGEAAAIPCNITHREQLQNLVDRSVERFGRIDILVCNAAVNVFYGSMGAIPDDAFDKTLTANVKSNHWLCQMALPGMVERGEGAIIVISSIGAVEYGPKNIRANTIAPGLIRTDFSRALWENDEFCKPRIAVTPLRRIGEPEEIAGAAVFLASDAGSFMTGQTLVVDGGVTI